MAPATYMPLELDDVLAMVDDFRDGSLRTFPTLYLAVEAGVLPGSDVTASHDGATPETGDDLVEAGPIPPFPWADHPDVEREMDAFLANCAALRVTRVRLDYQWDTTFNEIVYEIDSGIRGYRDGAWITLLNLTQERQALSNESRWSRVFWARLDRTGHLGLAAAEGRLVWDIEHDLFAIWDGEGLVYAELAPEVPAPEPEPVSILTPFDLSLERDIESGTVRFLNACLDAEIVWVELIYWVTASGSLDWDRTPTAHREEGLDTNLWTAAQESGLSDLTCSVTWRYAYWHRLRQSSLLPILPRTGRLRWYPETDALQILDEGGHDLGTDLNGERVA